MSNTPTINSISLSNNHDNSIKDITSHPKELPEVDNIPKEQDISNLNVDQDISNINKDLSNLNIGQDTSNTNKDLPILNIGQDTSDINKDLPILNIGQDTSDINKGQDTSGVDREQRKKYIEGEVVKILCIGDPHIMEDYLADYNKMVDEIYKVIDERKPDLIVIMGDVLDKHDKLHVDALICAENFIKECGRKTKTMLLIGNHDRPNNSVFLGNRHPFGQFRGNKDILLCEEVEKLDMKGCKFLGVPYVSPGRLMEAINSKVTEEEILDMNIIFGHQEVKDCVYGNRKSKNGDSWPEHYPLMINGHIHIYQKVGNNILYVGTPKQQNFGETEDKSISMIYIRDNKIGIEKMLGEKEGILMEKHGLVYSEERIRLDVPEKKTYYTNVHEFTKLLEDPYRFGLINYNERFVVHGSIEEIKTMNVAYSIQMKELNKRNIKVHTVPNKQQLPKREIFNPNAKFQERIKERLQQYPDLLDLFSEISI
ncbi:Mre11/SbcD-like exonuclease [Orpheovirus IHUMI-LCC2]|uniref:Mre11/SbcD-like exonuclease n=1 Tax=Orpheovirus IHUMI-LCC2 TaxID=2023057 RepID=A0A2I2L5K9_9VIRU|nr:Mre11/SbcD-like exonuclease [Orpheovirus IHUMI-LCC2]SNW62824.1 Mre11/SbcD-like exonuclease [Orpheovirus IHUMI-LCC2]